MTVPTQTLLEVLSDSSLEVLGIVPVLSKCSIKTNMSVSREEPLFFFFFLSELFELTRSVHRHVYSDLSTLQPPWP